MCSGSRVSERGPGVHHGDQRGGGIRQAEADPGAAHVPVHEGDPLAQGPHKRSTHTFILMSLTQRPFI